MSTNIPHDYYDGKHGHPHKHPEPHLHSRSDAWYVEPDFVAYDVDDQLPLLSTIGRGPAGEGMLAGIVEDSDEAGIFRFRIYSDETGETAFVSPNLHPGKIWVSQPKHEPVPGEVTQFTVYTRRGTETSEYTMEVNPGAEGSRIYLYPDQVKRDVENEVYELPYGPMVHYGKSDTEEWPEKPTPRVHDIVLMIVHDDSVIYFAAAKIEAVKDSTVICTARTYFPMYVPSVGENGNWWVGDVDTGLSVQGGPYYKPEIDEDGNMHWVGSEPGMPDVNGTVDVKGGYYTPSINDDTEGGTLVLTATKSYMDPQKIEYPLLKGKDGEKGDKGDTGPYYIPVAQNDLVGFDKSDESLPDIKPIDIRGPQGERGEMGYVYVPSIIENRYLHWETDNPEQDQPEDIDFRRLVTTEAFNEAYNALDQYIKMVADFPGALEDTLVISLLLYKIFVEEYWPKLDPEEYPELVSKEIFYKKIEEAHELIARYEEYGDYIIVSPSPSEPDPDSGITQEEYQEYLESLPMPIDDDDDPEEDPRPTSEEFVALQKRLRVLNNILISAYFVDLGLSTTDDVDALITEITGE